MTAEADALLAQGKRDAAIVSYEGTRSRCPLYDPVRRRLFLARHSPATRAATPVFVDATVHLSVKGSLKDDVVFSRSAAFLDGYPLRDKRATGMRVNGHDLQIQEDKIPRDQNTTRIEVGEHELTVELYMEPRTPAGPPLRRIDFTAILNVPLSLAGQGPLVAIVDVGVRDNGPNVTVGDRFFTAVQAKPFKPVAQLRFPTPPGQPPVLTATLLPPNVGAAQRLAPAAIVLPDELRSKTFWVLVKVCVSTEGIVSDVKFLKEEPEVSQALSRMIRTWRYMPYTINGRPVPFCHPARLSHSAP